MASKIEGAEDDHLSTIKVAQTTGIASNAWGIRDNQGVAPLSLPPEGIFESWQAVKDAVNKHAALAGYAIIEGRVVRECPKRVFAGEDTSSANMEIRKTALEGLKYKMTKSKSHNAKQRRQIATSVYACKKVLTQHGRSIILKADQLIIMASTT